MLLTAAIVALGLNGAPSCALPRPAEDLSWTRGERLTYDVQALGVRQKGGFVLEATPSGNGIELTAEGRLSAPVLRFRGLARSSIDARTLRPRRFHDELDDGTLRTTDCDFTRPGLTVRVEWTRAAKRGTNAFLKKATAFDAISAIYSLRSVDLEPGARFCLEAAGGRRYFRLSGRRAGEVERVDTPAGEIEAIRLDAVAVQADDASERHTMRMWISTDGRRLPVALEFDTSAGVVRGLLASVSS